MRDQDEDEETGQQSCRESYEPPKVTAFGTLQELTRGALFTGADDGDRGS
jgi:hypothetical protein